MTASTRQRLIDTALHLVTKRSYQTVSVDDICAAASVNKGSLYHFFPTKMALVAAGLQQESRASKEFYEESFSGRGDCISRFDRFAERLYDKQFRLSKTYGRVCGCTVTALASELAGQDDAIGALCCDLLRHQERCLEIALREMVAEQTMPASTDLKFIAQNVNSYVAGQMMLARILNDLTPLKRELRQGMFVILGVSRV